MQLKGPHGIIGTPTYAAYVEKHQRYANDRNEAVVERGDTLQMFANEGRWVASCTHCNSGVVAHPSWPDARCLGCGSVFTSVAWPEEMADIEAELTVRPRVNQNWMVDESLARLSRENVERDLPSAFVDALLDELDEKVEVL